ncbi:two component transcriptional regulator, LytTR family [Fulvivirga imtechensis AK7]|uniref:Two component transcriptional regulator, LytTR family n=1 Tax=Fulvivirga imtechensis AK7 TaxID=1237149 RepID=L8JUP9_9BACT|nr:response regulator [Fulvivirga imtechensis]ELR72726.1 two component transcriptional regulator, LytTR family [Fulvivirga imtechensis AK7]
MIRVVLIDDENTAIRALQTLLHEYFDYIEVVGTASSLDEGKIVVLRQKPDLVFLDIELRDGTGFDLLEAIPVNFKVVFVTAYSEYALKAIKKRAFDYLLKPVDVDELARTLDDIKRELQTREAPRYPARLSIPCKNGSLYIQADQILKLDASGSYSKIFLENGDSHMASHNLSYFEKLLDPGRFFRCHHSHIVNLTKVKRVLFEMGMIVVLTDGSCVDVSKRKKTEFNQRMADIPNR